MSDQETFARSTSARKSLSAQPGNSPVNVAPLSPGATQDMTGRSWSGRTLGEYEIGELLGRGGNGEVYRGKHRWLNRPIAIKFLTGVRADDEESMQRFQREAQVAAALNHPNIVRATDGGAACQQLFLVTDLVDGCDLSQLVNGLHRLSVANVCAIGSQAARALGYVASRNIVHRDVKPSNLMLDREGNVKLLDLGLARVMDHGHTMTATGQVMGTIDYMAPEQATDPRRVDERADIYSLGGTLYYLLIGQAPFSTDHLDTLAAKLLATMESDPTPIKNFRRDVPPKLVRFIETMLDKDPSRRPKDFQSVEKALQPFIGGADLVAIAADDSIESSSSEMPGAKLRPLTSSGSTTSISSHVGDIVAASTRKSIRVLLQCLGMVEPIPVMRPGQRQSYRFSFRWLKVLAVFGALAGFLWFTGFRIYTADPRLPPGSQEIPTRSINGTTTGVQINSLFDS